jgi:hypothetical protein
MGRCLQLALSFHVYVHVHDKLEASTADGRNTELFLKCWTEEEPYSSASRALGTVPDGINWWQCRADSNVPSSLRINIARLIEIPTVCAAYCHLVRWIVAPNSRPSIIRSI